MQTGCKRMGSQWLYWVISTWVTTIQGPSTLGLSGHADGLGKPPGFFHVPEISEK